MVSYEKKVVISVIVAVVAQFVGLLIMVAAITYAVKWVVS